MDEPFELAHIEEYRRQNAGPREWIMDTHYSTDVLRIAMEINDDSRPWDCFEEYVPYDAWFFQWRVERAKKRILKKIKRIEVLKGDAKR
jgi:hypothetical protein